jgi:hypothetical protein
MQEWRAPIAENAAAGGAHERDHRDLLELSRLESSQSKAGLDEVALPGLLEQIVREGVRHASRSARVEIVLDSRASLRGSEESCTAPSPTSS